MLTDPGADQFWLAALATLALLAKVAMSIVQTHIAHRDILQAKADASRQAMARGPVVYRMCLNCGCRRVGAFCTRCGRERALQ